MISDPEMCDSEMSGTNAKTFPAWTPLKVTLYKRGIRNALLENMYTYHQADEELANVVLEIGDQARTIPEDLEPNN